MGFKLVFILTNFLLCYYSVKGRYLEKRATFYIANETACVVDGVVYSNSDPIPTDDPCETCRCRPPGFACVLQECEVKPGCRAVRQADSCCPEYICGCEHDGRMYRDGDEIRDSQNPCYICHCQGNSIACAFVDCFFRIDCTPEYVPGECCPRYDHCSKSTISTRTYYESTTKNIDQSKATQRTEAPKMYYNVLQQSKENTKFLLTAWSLVTETEFFENATQDINKSEQNFSEKVENTHPFTEKNTDSFITRSTENKENIFITKDDDSTTSKKVTSTDESMCPTSNNCGLQISYKTQHTTVNVPDAIQEKKHSIKEIFGANNDTQRKKGNFYVDKIDWKDDDERHSGVKTTQIFTTPLSTPAEISQETEKISPHAQQDSTKSSHQSKLIDKQKELIKKSAEENVTYETEEPNEITQDFFLTTWNEMNSLVSELEMHNINSGTGARILNFNETVTFENGKNNSKNKDFVQNNGQSSEFEKKVTEKKFSLHAPPYKTTPPYKNITEEDRKDSSFTTIEEENIEKHIEGEITPSTIPILNTLEMMNSEANVEYDTLTPILRPEDIHI